VPTSSGHRPAAIVLVLALALLIGSAHTHVRPAAAQAQPQFNPSSFTCSSYPFGPVLPGRWQTSAPRAGADVVQTGDSVQLGLRKQDGGPGDSYYALAQVWAPDGTLSSAQTMVSGSDWAYLMFPDDFDENADTDLAGVYTVLWTIGPLNVACDGFVVH
jgi:hypothetical protein